MREFFWKHDAGVKALLLLVVFLLAANLFFINSALFSTTPSKAEEEPAGFPLNPFTVPCGKECQKTVEELVAQAVATLSAQPKATTVVTQVTKETKTTFIPLPGSFSTQNRTWTDVKGSDVYIDISDYGGNGAWVGFEATIKIAHANGKAFARLFDTTHGIAVADSEVSTESGDSAVVSSGDLQLWAGNNLYRVQVKSLNGFEASFDSGRVKIVSK